MAAVFAYITVEGADNAAAIAHALIEKRLAGCVNRFPLQSVYRWEGKVRDAEEFALIAKTTEARFAALQDAVRRMHPDEVPCIARLRAEPNADYLAWLEKEVD